MVFHKMRLVKEKSEILKTSFKIVLFFIGLSEKYQIFGYKNC